MSVSKNAWNCGLVDLDSNIMLFSHIIHYLLLLFSIVQSFISTYWNVIFNLCTYTSYYTLPFCKLLNTLYNLSSKYHRPNSNKSWQFDLLYLSYVISMLGSFQLFSCPKIISQFWKVSNNNGVFSLHEKKLNFELNLLDLINP